MDLEKDGHKRQMANAHALLLLKFRQEFPEADDALIKGLIQRYLVAFVSMWVHVSLSSRRLDVRFASRRSRAAHLCVPGVSYDHLLIQGDLPLEPHDAPRKEA